MTHTKRDSQAERGRDKGEGLIEFICLHITKINSSP